MRNKDKEGTPRWRRCCERLPVLWAGQEQASQRGQQAGVGSRGGAGHPWGDGPGGRTATCPCLSRTENKQKTVPWHILFTNLKLALLGPVEHRWAQRGKEPRTFDISENLIA